MHSLVVHRASWLPAVLVLRFLVDWVRVGSTSFAASFSEAWSTFSPCKATLSGGSFSKAFSRLETSCEGNGRKPQNVKHWQIFWILLSKGKLYYCKSCWRKSVLYLSQGIMQGPYRSPSNLHNPIPFMYLFILCGNTHSQPISCYDLLVVSWNIFNAKLFLNYALTYTLKWWFGVNFTPLLCTTK